jgi:hypothetical protein
MRVLVVALCCAASAAFLPASSALAWSGPGSADQSNGAAQVVVVSGQGAQPAGLIGIGSIVAPVNIQVPVGISHVLSGIGILGSGVG